MDCYQVYNVFSGWLQVYQDSMFFGGIQGDFYYFFFFISGVVVQNEFVCWRRWVILGDVYIGGGDMRKV